MILFMYIFFFFSYYLGPFFNDKEHAPVALHSSLIRCCVYYGCITNTSASFCCIFIWVYVSWWSALLSLGHCIVISHVLSEFQRGLWVPEDNHHIYSGLPALSAMSKTETDAIKGLSNLSSFDNTWTWLTLRTHLLLKDLSSGFHCCWCIEAQCSELRAQPLKSDFSVSVLSLPSVAVWSGQAT